MTTLSKNLLKYILENITDTTANNLTKNLLSLMCHRNTNHNNDYPQHAKDLMSCLKKNLSYSEINHPENIEKIEDNVIKQVLLTLPMNGHAIPYFEKLSDGGKSDFLVWHAMKIYNVILAELEKNKKPEQTLGADDATPKIQDYLKSSEGKKYCTILKSIPTEHEFFDIISVKNKKSTKGSEIWIIHTFWHFAQNIPT